MKIAIAGAGAMGSRLGIMLHQGGNDVTLIDQWPAHIEAIRKNGLIADFNGEEVVANLPIFSPEEIDHQNEQVDLIIALTKAQQLDAMFKAIQPMITEKTYVLCLLNGLGHEDVLEKYVMDQILEIIKSKKVLKQLVEKVNEKSQIDVSSLNHDIAYKQSQCEEIKAKMHTLTKTIEDSPDLDSVLKPTILSYQDELNQINNQIYQLEQDKQAEAPHYDADMIANVLQAIFKDIDKLEKSQLKSLYLTIIDRIDIRKDEHHKKQFYVTLKLNNDIIKQLFNNHPLDEVLPSTSSLFLPQTLYITIE